MIGVNRNEPFAIRFTNSSYNRVQIRLSLDGTDVLSGNLANTNANGDMFLVESNSSFVLKAFPESLEGGAQFVFTDVQNGVAANTHGNLESKGIIAAAVFIEGEQKTNTYKHNTQIDSRRRRITKGVNFEYTSECKTSGGIYTFDEISESSTASIGAGEAIQQKLAHVKGLSKPILSTIVKLKYVWSNELEGIINSKKLGFQPGFPGDKKMINLNGVPRVVCDCTSGFQFYS